MSWRRSHEWGALTRDEIRQARDAGAVAVLPAGSIEQHGEHLPVDTDLFSVRHVALAAAERCETAFALVLPALPFGFAPEHAEWPGTVTLSLATFAALVGEVAQSVRRAGFDRLLVVNGHGGNEAPLWAICGEASRPGFALAAVNYWSPGSKQWSPVNPGGKPTMGHACAYETSLQLALRPSARDLIAGRASRSPPRLDPPAIGAAGPALRMAGARYAAAFPAGDPGYYGDPAAATAEAGATMLELTISGLAQFYSVFATTSFRQ